MLIPSTYILNQAAHGPRPDLGLFVHLTSAIVPHASSSEAT